MCVSTEKSHVSSRCEMEGVGRGGAGCRKVAFLHMSFCLSLDVYYNDLAAYPEPLKSRIDKNTSVLKGFRKLERQLPMFYVRRDTKEQHLLGFYLIS